jgi:hypothetical protein
MDDAVKPLSEGVPTRYAGTYTDARGSEAIVFHNDGATLRVCIRGVRLSGEDFDALTPDSGTAPELLAAVTLHHDCLCACALSVNMPVWLNVGGTEQVAQLRCLIELGVADPRGGLDHESIALELEHSAGRSRSSGRSGWFEGELLELQAQLPAGHFIKACINCLYSDYSVYGHGAFGDMICHRRCKTEYLAVRSKLDFMQLRGPTELVQETYLCAQFARREPGTGYRG